MTSPLVLIWPIGHPRFCGHSDTKGGPYDPPLVSLCPQKLGCPIGNIRTNGEVRLTSP